MKTMKKNFGFQNQHLLKFVVLCLVLAVGVSSCNKSDDPVSNADQASVTAESSEDSYHNDADDLANGAAGT